MNTSEKCENTDYIEVYKELIDTLKELGCTFFTVDLKNKSLILFSKTKLSPILRSPEFLKVVARKFFSLPDSCESFRVKEKYRAGNDKRKIKPGLHISALDNNNVMVPITQEIIDCAFIFACQDHLSSILSDPQPLLYVYPQFAESVYDLKHWGINEMLINKLQWVCLGDVSLETIHERLDNIFYKGRTDRVYAIDNVPAKTRHDANALKIIKSYARLYNTKGLKFVRDHNGKLVVSD